ncbi:biopolymer transporter ExbB [Histidinibacterium aquaticum]|uniref:Biopolymer transporter ExbB n=1 Tax=Histidinibacterium aquaticum TaxID=2613962 RepID=A0A5J5GJ68_9RHOB|nr:biopolymer transporter ExbB [Histidinibacterium aquaticum]KAA9008276.1 biopolymer transporter ExbB [Histidinibacterium aquaticum]
MAKRSPEAEPQFSQPRRPVTLMLIVLALVAVGVWFALPRVGPVFAANPYLNGFIGLVFVVGVGYVFLQVAQIIQSVRWIEGFAAERPGHDLTSPPGLLAPLATLLRSRGARMQLSATSSRSILESVAQRIDEDREISRYIVNLLIFLGLLGTFYGLATTVPGLVQTIGSLSAEEGESGADIFNRLQDGLQTQLGGMGVAFASSLLGLAGSLVLGLLELLAGHGQNRFYRELEEWLSTITRVGISGEEGGGEAGVMGQVIDNLAEQMEALQMMFTQTDIGRAAVDERLGDLAASMEALAQKMEAGTTLSDQLGRVAEGQERLIKVISDSGIEGIDAESRMRLRSIDVQLLRILEEMAAGRQEVVEDLRTDLAALGRSMRGRATEREG